MGKGSGTRASTILFEHSSKLEYRRKGVSGRPPPFPSLAAATSGMTLGPFTGG